jgi:hypothetical protein
VVKPYVEKKVGQFFDAREDVDTPDEVQKVDPEDAITEKDFDFKGDDDTYSVPFNYLYDVVMEGVKKVDGVIDHTAYTITFDEDLTPDRCEKTGIYYGCMHLAGKPVLYYIRLNLADLIAEVRNHDFDPQGPRAAE